MSKRAWQAVGWWALVIVVLSVLGLFGRWVWDVSHRRTQTLCASAARKYERATFVTRDNTCMVVTRNGHPVPFNEYEGVRLYVPDL